MVLKKLWAFDSYDQCIRCDHKETHEYCVLATSCFQINSITPSGTVLEVTSNEFILGTHYAIQRNTF